MKLNIFNNHKSENKKHGAEVAEKPSQKVVENLPDSNSEQKEVFDFNVVLDNINKLIDLKREIGGTVSAEEVEQIARMPVGELMKVLNGRKVEISTNGEEMMDALQFAISATEGKADQNMMQRFANDKVKRGIVMLLILMGKFAPHAHAADNASKVKDKEFTKNETTFEKHTEPDPNTYVPTIDELNGHHDGEKANDAKALDSKMEGDHNTFSLKFTDHFSTDSEKMIDGDKDAIAKDFKDFLSHLTPESAKKMIGSRLVVTGFCDERETPKWGTNEKLATARVNTASDFIESILKDPNSTKHLPADISAKLQSLKITHDVFESKTGPDKGVKYITDLKNPDTGKNFTQEEVNKIKEEAKTSEEGKAKLLKLQSECRGVVFNVKVVNEGIPKMQLNLNTIDVKHPGPVVKQWLGGYNNIIIVADNTPSMKDISGGHVSSNLYIAKIISETKSLDGVKKYAFGSFDSNGLNLESFKNVMDLQEVSKDIKELDGLGDGRKEASLTAGIQALENFQPVAGDKTVLKILTDEPLQDVTLSNFYKLEKLAKDKNVTVAFAYGDDAKQTLNEISLEEGGKMLKDFILKINGHPSVNEILKANDGKTVEDHLGQIYAPLISKKANEIIKWYSEKAVYEPKSTEKYIEDSSEKIDKYKKVVESSKDKNSNHYQKALRDLSEATATKNFYESRNNSFIENAKICNEYGPELKKLADAYVSSGDKSLLSHPYFAIFSGLVKEQDYFNNQKDFSIESKSFLNKIDLSKNTK